MQDAGAHYPQCGFAQVGGYRCDEPVAWDWRCIFHAPKTSYQTRGARSGAEGERSEDIDTQFWGHFSELMRIMQADGTVSEYNFRGFQFPDLRFEPEWADKSVSFVRAHFWGQAVFGDVGSGSGPIMVSM